MGQVVQSVKGWVDDAVGATYSGLSAARDGFAERRRRRGESAAFEAAFARASFISGWLNRKEAELLFELASTVPPGQDIVEVGSYLGRSTAFLAQGASAAGVTVHAVDPFDGGQLQLVSREENFDTSKQFWRNMREIGVAERVEAHVTTSTSAAASYVGRPVGLLFVDGNHSEKAVYADGSGWAPHLAPRCLLAFDDIGWQGVTRGLHRLCADGVLPPIAGRVDKIGLCGPADLWPERVRTLARAGDPAATSPGPLKAFFRKRVLPGAASGPSPHPAADRDPG